MNAKIFNFLSNNIKDLQTSKNRSKLHICFKNKMFPNGILFLQETHSTKENEIKWKDKFDDNLYFSNGKSNLFGVVIGFSGNKIFTVKKRVCDENVQILILKNIDWWISVLSWSVFTMQIHRVKKFKHLMSWTCCYQT